MASETVKEMVEKAIKLLEAEDESEGLSEDCTEALILLHRVRERF